MLALVDGRAQRGRPDGRAAGSDPIDQGPHGANAEKDESGALRALQTLDSRGVLAGVLRPWLALALARTSRTVDIVIRVAVGTICPLDSSALGGRAFLHPADSERCRISLS